MGLVERDGRVLAGPVADTTQNTLEPIVLRNVHPESLVATDEAKAYNDLRHSFRQHGRVNHSAEEWVRGSFHTNTIEGHWSQLKRSIRGTHVHVSAKHLWKYVSEFSYRRNMRHSQSDMFNRLLLAFSLPRLADS
jgi:transposase-like protein